MVVLYMGSLPLIVDYAVICDHSKLLLVQILHVFSRCYKQKQIKSAHGTPSKKCMAPDKLLNSEQDHLEFPFDARETLHSS